MKKKLLIILIVLLAVLGASFYYFGNGTYFKRCPLTKTVDCFPGPKSILNLRVFCGKEYRDWTEVNCSDVNFSF